MIGSIPNYYLVRYLRDRLIHEVWSKADNRIVSRSIMESGGIAGHNLRLPSGKMIKASPNYINGNIAAFLIQADAAYEEIGIEGIKMDDNPIIVILQLKD